MLRQNVVENKCFGGILVISIEDVGLREKIKWLKICVEKVNNVNAHDKKVMEKFYVGLGMS